MTQPRCPDKDVLSEYCLGKLPEPDIVTTHDADARNDIYSLGCTLHFLLTGRAPYGGDNVTQKLLAHRDAPIPSLQQSREEVPASLDLAFQKMIAKQPESRYQTMEEVIAALGSAAQSQSPVLASQRKRYGEDSKLDVFLSQMGATIDRPAVRPAAKPAKPAKSKPKPAADKPRALRIPQIPRHIVYTIAGGLAAILLLGVITLTLRTPKGEVHIEVAEEIADQVEVVLSQSGKQVTVSKEDDWTIKLKEGTWDVADPRNEQIDAW